MRTNCKPVELELAVSRLTFQWCDRTLVWDANPDSQWEPDVYRASGMYDESGFATGRWFVFYHEDCFQPSVYVIRAESFETAYEVFIEEFGAKACGVIEPNENVSNYGDGTTVDSLLNSGVLTWTANGIIDTEAIKGEEITLVSASMA